MKALKLIIPIAGLLLTTVTVNSQSLYDANRLIGSDLNGTARFVGMGGAMGALGGDITTIGTNPAGIGIYRSSDINVSFGFSNVGVKSNLNGSKIETDKFFGSFDNAGFVLSLKQGDYTPVRFVNFGFNYTKSRSFDKNLVMGGTFNGEMSQTDQIAHMTEDLTVFGKNPYFNHDIGWLSIMGYDGWLIHPNPDKDTPVGLTETDFPYLDKDGEQIYDENGDALYYQKMKYTGIGLNPRAKYSSRERGGMHNYDFNLALNFSDRFYLGATVGVIGVDYTKESIYEESSGDGNYTLENWMDTQGTGFNFKLGGILRVVDNFRIGAAIHIPTFYRLTDYHGARLTSHFGNDTYVQDTYKEANEAETRYKLITPWKYNFSLGYVIGNNVALGAEYEYIDHSTAKLKYDDGVKMDGENDRISNGLKGVSTIRLGAEFRIVPEFSIRAGYNHVTASTRDNDKSYKALAYNTIRTDTDYLSGKAADNFTLGFGYRGNNFYADMAYQYHHSKDEFYPFDYKKMPATDITNNKHQLLFTLGMRF